MGKFQHIVGYNVLRDHKEDVGPYLHVLAILIVMQDSIDWLSDGYYEHILFGKKYYVKNGQVVNSLCY